MKVQLLCKLQSVIQMLVKVVVVVVNIIIIIIITPKHIYSFSTMGLSSQCSFGVPPFLVSSQTVSCPRYSLSSTCQWSVYLTSISFFSVRS